MGTKEDLVLTRVLAAPRSLVWKVWTDPAHLVRWWGPAGFALKVAKFDLKVGGLLHYSMTAPESNLPIWGKFEYDVVQPVERLEFRSAFSDDQGGTVPNPMSQVWPLQISNVLTLTEADGQTTLTLRGRPFHATEEEAQAFADHHPHVSQGFAGTFAQLEAYLADQMVADRALVYRRTFDAPRAVVWKAWTSPSRIAAWWGPSGFGNTIEAMDVRPGGRWVFTMHGPDGTDYPNEVVYREVQEPSRLAYDHGEPGSPAEFQVTVSFTEVGEKTEILYRMVFPTKEAKQLVIEKYGAEEGLKQNMDRFAHWLTKSGLLLTRVLGAPRALVWKAFTDPVHLQKWWGPEHFTCPGARVDLHLGGKYLLGMRGPDGQEFWSTGTYKEIILNQKLVYTDSFSDAQGHPIPAATLGLPGDWPEEALVSITFAELGKGKTLVTIHQEYLPDEWRDMTVSGWSTSLDKLQKILPPQ